MKLDLKMEHWFRNLKGWSLLWEMVCIKFPIIRTFLSLHLLPEISNRDPFKYRLFLSCIGESCENNEERRKGLVDSEATM